MDPVPNIAERVTQVLASLPEGVTLVAAVKGRTPSEIQAAIEAGVRCVGHNYVQEAESMVQALGRPAEIHLIGHLQRKKVPKVLDLFDLVETLDSASLAQALDERCRLSDRTLPVLVEINSGREPNKSGVLPEDAEAFLRSLRSFERLKVVGLMTMGPWMEDPEGLRPSFKATRELFQRLRDLPGGSQMQHLSMGMSDSYRVAIEEGATWIRLGTRLFGARPS